MMSVLFIRCFWAQAPYHNVTLFLFQALVYNVLPPHVARHFMGAHRNHRDLYSQSYAEVGVLFAAMPNFTGNNDTSR